MTVTNNNIDYLLSDGDYQALKEIKEEIVSGCSICGGSGIKESKKQTDDTTAWKQSELCKCIKKFRKYKMYYKSRIPEVYWDVTEKNFYGDKKALKIVSKFMDHLENAANNGLGFHFYGDNGNGKTSLANIFAKEALVEGFSVYYSTLQNILNLIIQSFNDDRIRDKVRYLIVNVDFLIIDEIGKEHLKANRETGTVFGLSEFEQLLRDREGKKKSTTILSNDNPDKVEAKYKKSIASLIKGTMKVVHVEGVDTRRTIKKNKWEDLLRGKS